MSVTLSDATKAERCSPLSKAGVGRVAGSFFHVNGQIQEPAIFAYGPFEEAPSGVVIKNETSPNQKAVVCEGMLK